MNAHPIVVSVRLRHHSARRLDQRAQTENLDRSDLLRVMLAYANQHMPPGWRPQGWKPASPGRPRKETIR